MSKTTAKIPKKNIVTYDVCVSSSKGEARLCIHDSIKNPSIRLVMKSKCDLNVSGRSMKLNGTIMIEFRSTEEGMFEEFIDKISDIMSTSSEVNKISITCTKKDKCITIYDYFRGINDDVDNITITNNSRAINDIKDRLKIKINGNHTVRFHVTTFH